MNYDIRCSICPFAIVLIMLPLAMLGCGGDGLPSASDTPIVYVSIPPQGHFAERLVQDKAEVRVLLPPGMAPNYYEPRPSELEALSNASLYVRAGAPFENNNWDRIRRLNPDMKVVDGTEGVEKRRFEPREAVGHDHPGHGDDHADEHSYEAGEPDPHTWLAPTNMITQVRVMGEAMRELDPDNAEFYAEREEALVEELEELDQELASILEPVQGETFWVYHPAWGYFADAYGLEQQAIEHEGKDPGVQSLGNLVREGQEQAVEVIFLEAQFDSRAAEVLAGEIGARVEVLDPLARDYAENLRATARAIREALS
ncbi:MAG: zinc ABC transporter substrate-binding protein [Candidatus Hydrogenedentota bacterium]